MANVKISELPDATLPLSGSEAVPLVQSGVTSQATAQDIADLGGGLSAPVTPTQGGTGITAYAQGDLLYASATNVLARLPENATGSRYLSSVGPGLSGAFSILVGINATGPVTGPGDGSGYYIGTLNGGASCGSCTPDPAIVTGPNQVIICGWRGISGGRFVVGIAGTHLQTAFVQVSLGAPANLTFLTNAVASFDNTTYPGYSLWYWADGNEFSYIAQNLSVAITDANGLPAWAQVNLIDGVIGDLPYSNIAQGAANSVLGVTGDETADLASIVAGTSNQVLRLSGSTLAFGAVNLASSSAVTGALALTNGGTGQTTANTALNALLPNQATHAAQVLTTDGTNTSWAAASTTAGIPQNAQPGDYTFVLADNGKSVYYDTADTVNTWTIPPNASVAFPLGAAITLVNFDPTLVSTLALVRGVGVSLYVSNGDGTDTDYQVTAQQVGTLLKTATDTWMIVGI